MLVSLSHALINNREKVSDLYKVYSDEIDKLIPSDIILAVDHLMKEDIDLEDLKTAINKLLNLVFKPIKDYKHTQAKEGSFLDYLVKNSEIAAHKLRTIGGDLKRYNKQKNQENAYLLKEAYMDLLPFVQVYTIKENVLFPIIEKAWGHFRCVKLMWAFHDDIRRDLKSIISLLDEPTEDLARINRLAGDISFRIMAIKFRDEEILFPEMLDTIQEEQLEAMWSSNADMNFPFVEAPKERSDAIPAVATMPQGKVDLGTGAILPEQIKLIFNHLPVDITYVDEHNKVQYYSTPKHRIFPRTQAVLGRDVHNCHPPDSVHVVEEIVESFRNGKKDRASFWIHMGPNFVLIQYFAVRDARNVFKGTLEVSQEISEIQSLQGDRRLLDWD